MKRSFGALLALGALALDSPAHAQRADANVLTDAADAFGFSKAGDAVGLYSSASVRGFSPSRAGNLRLEGLYFDRQAFLVQDALDHTRIHVGLTALDFPFPAPSGIADYGLKPSDRDVTTVYANGGPSQYGYDATLDLARADLGGGFSFAGGLRGVRGDYPMGGGTDFLASAAILRWASPERRVRLTAFGASEVYRKTNYDPTFYVAGPDLPGPVARHGRLLQTWTGGRGYYNNEGVLTDVALSSKTALRAGLFRSVWTSERDYDQVYDPVADGRGALTVYAYPERRFASISGEARLIHDEALGPLDVRGILAVRGRAVDRRFGGEDAIDLGTVDLTGDARRPKPPTFRFAEQSRDSIDQIGFGAQIKISWAKHGQFTGGLERVRYEKGFAPPGGARTRGVSEAWLYNVAAAWQVRPRLTVFAAANRGLEDTGIAPASAANRGEVLPAILSKQREVGLRVQAGKSLTVTTAAFHLEKPYPGFSAGGRYDLVGTLKNKGVEVSALAHPAQGLTVLAGLYAAKPELDGGRAPLGSFRRQAQLYVDYALPRRPSVSFDVRITHQGDTVVRDDLDADARTEVQLGARWRGTLDGKPLSLRLSAYNAFGEGGWTVDPAGGLSKPARRAIVASVSRTF